MSIWKNGKLIAGGRQTMPLLSFMWADHQLNDISWLRADTFSWQSGAVYTAVYQHLVDDYNNIPTEATVYVYHSVSPVGYFYRDSYFDVSGANHPYAYAMYNNDGSINVLYADHQTGETTDNYYENADGSGTYYSGGFTSGSLNIRPVKHETINGNIISFYEAQDGHKIALDKDTLSTINELPRSQESNVAAIYAATGVAWYYIIDTSNQRFKLPRTKWGFTGIRNGVGGYVEPELPNITGSVNLTGSGVTTTPLFNSNDVADSALYNNVSITAGRYHNDSNTGSGYNRIEIDASRSSSIYKDGATVQPKATEMYLYFYVGQFTQTAIEQTAGINAGLFNGKADLNLSNTASNVDFVVESQEPTAGNNYTWYRKYKSGWVEQGGVFPATSGWATSTISLPITMQDMYYTLTNDHAWETSDTLGSIIILTKTTTNFSARYFSRAAAGYSTWFIAGMAA